MDWISTLPKQIRWDAYEQELKAVLDGSQEMMYRVRCCPKNIQEGDRWFVLWNGYVRGWMSVTGVVQIGQFQCTTTGKVWPPGWYIKRSGQFHHIEPIPMKGFQGYRKFNQTGEENGHNVI